MITTIAFLVTSVVCAFLSFAMWDGRRAKLRQRLLLATMIQFVSLWAIMRFFAGFSTEQTASLAYFQFATFGGGLAASMFFGLVQFLGGNNLKKSIVHLIVALSVAGLSFTSIGILDIEHVNGDIDTVQFGVGYLLYALFFAATFAYAFIHLVRSSKGPDQLSADASFSLKVVSSVAIFIFVFGIIPDLVGVSAPISIGLVEASAVLAATGALGYRIIVQDLKFIESRWEMKKIRTSAIKTVVLSALVILLFVMAEQMILNTSLLIGLIAGLSIVNFSAKARMLLLSESIGVKPSSYVLWSELTDSSIDLSSTSLLKVLEGSIKEDSSYSDIHISVDQDLSEEDHISSDRRSIQITKRLSHNRYLVFMAKADKRISIMPREISKIDQFLNDAAAIIHTREKNSEKISTIINENKRYLSNSVRLAKQNENKDDFISIASHQLRTPISVATLNNKMMLEGTFGDLTKEQQAAIAESQDSVEQMSHIVDNLLDAARIDQGTFKIKKTFSDVNKLANAAVERNRQNATQKEINIERSLSKQLPKINIDEVKIGEVISNMIDNAIKYSPENSKVSVSTKKTGSNITVRIKDQGPGVSTEDKKQLFTKFGRAKRAKKQRPEGLGLGLYLARITVEAHRGEVLIESNSQQGATFGFSIPVK